MVEYRGGLIDGLNARLSDAVSVWAHLHQLFHAIVLIRILPHIGDVLHQE